jgi:hypothetical protein
MTEEILRYEKFTAILANAGIQKAYVKVSGFRHSPE